MAVAPASVAEDGAVNLVYTFNRVGFTTNALTVSFTVSGTAKVTTGDYTQAGAASYDDTAGTVTFTAGSSTATVTLDPTADSTLEPDETVSLTLASGSGYSVVSPSAGVFVISQLKLTEVAASLSSVAVTVTS